MHECSNGKIWNPKTKRCVKLTGAVGKELLKKYPNAKPVVKCNNDQVFNKKTGRCVKKTGEIGKQIMEGKSPKYPKKKEKECPEGKIRNHESGKCINIDGKVGFKLYEEKMFKEIKPKAGECIDRSAVALKEYQRKVANFLKTHDELLVVHQTGTGKTLSAVTASQCYLDRNPNSKVLVVTPASVVHNFRKEMIKYGVTNPEKYIIVSFATFRQHPEKYPNKNFMMIIDEAHTARTPESKTYKTLYKKAMKADKRMLLTATPYVNDIRDLCTISWLLFGDYTVMKNDSDDLICTMDQVKKALNKKVDVVETTEDGNYPTKKEKMEIIYMPEDSYERMKKSIEDDIQKWWDEHPEAGPNANPNAFYNITRKHANLSDDKVDKLKAKRTYKLIKNHSQNVVYANFIDNGVKILTGYLRKKNKTYKIISGKTPKTERQVIIKHFNEGKIDTLIITDAGREGIDLKGVRNMVLMMPPWSEALIRQVVGRAVRYKSHLHLPEKDRNVNVYFVMLVPPKSIYEEQQKIPQNIISCMKFNLKNPTMMKTGDQCLYAIIAKKRKEQRDIMKMLKKIQI